MKQTERNFWLDSGLFIGLTWLLGITAHLVLHKK